jgi:alcohol dehydrogenase class IV
MVMSMNFEFATASRIIFGPGSIKKLGSFAGELGHKALVTSGFRDGSESNCSLVEILQASGVESQCFTVPGEPTVDLVQAGVELAKAGQFDLVIGFGGGSAMDTGKAIAAMSNNPGELLDYLEVIGRGKTLSMPSLPVITIPTTAGTGSEVTRNAVLGSKGQRVKVSLRSPWMLPRLALVDPELTYQLPPSITASTGLDALTQLIEPFVCNTPSPLVDALCREGVRRAAVSLRNAYFHGDDHQAREDMSLASLFGGLALANAKLGAVHGFAGVLGGMYPAPHGFVCARLLPLVVETNITALRDRDAQNPALEKYGEIARLLTGDLSAVPEDAVLWLRDLCNELRIPGLQSYGFQPGEIPLIVEKSAQASSMKGNPLKLTWAELETILAKAG